MIGFTVVFARLSIIAPGSLSNCGTMDLLEIEMYNLHPQRRIKKIIITCA